MDIYSVEVISANQLRAGAVWHLSPLVCPMLTRARPVLIESGVIMFSVSTSPVSTLLSSPAETEPSKYIYTGQAPGHQHCASRCPHDLVVIICPLTLLYRVDTRYE